MEFSECNFDEKSFFTKLNFGRQISFINCNLTNCSFINSNIEDVRFLNCSFDFDKFPYKDFISGRFTDVEFKEIKDIIASYREFEINFDKNKDYELAGEFHKIRYELELLITKKYSLKKFLLWLYKWSSDFGENYGKSFGWFLSFLIFFTILYLFTGLKYENSNINWSTGNCYNPLNDLGCSFLYALNNALPFRRDLEFIKSANGITTFFAIVETLFETILVTLFIIGLRRKFKR